MLGPLMRFRFARRLYSERVDKRLTEVYDKGKVREMSLDVETERLVVLSDQHKGARNGADDFWRCEPAYCAALGYYLEAGFKLCILGDAEELWEVEAPGPILDHYKEVLALEKEFQGEPGQYVRCWGNHDLHWRDEPSALQQRLPGLELFEGVKLHLKQGGEELGEAFLVHGHQGTIESEQLHKVSKQAVGKIHAPIQRWRKKASTTPARDWRLRDAHSLAMYKWAAGRDRPLLLIAGHTHEPIFSAPPPLDQDADQAALPPAWARAQAEARAAKHPDRSTKALRYEEMETACYFNTGCCSYGDGSISGLEICDGKIRLVSWPWPWGKDPPSRVTLDEASLRAVFKALPARGD